MYNVEEQTPSGEWLPIREFRTLDDARVFCELASLATGGAYRIIGDNEILDSIDSEGSTWLLDSEQDSD